MLSIHTLTNNATPIPIGAKRMCAEQMCAKHMFAKHQFDSQLALSVCVLSKCVLSICLLSTIENQKEEEILSLSSRAHEMHH